MSPADLAVLAGAGLTTAILLWFFFGSKHAARARVVDGTQEVEVTVRGGYAPAVVRARQGVPLRMVFDRQEGGDCTSRVVLPDFGISRPLPAFARTTVELLPATTGSFEFACGMNMVHGTLIVEPSGRSGHGSEPDEASKEAELPGEGTTEKHAPAPETEDTEATERRAEIRDLTRRVAVGAVLTAPVAPAVMAEELFGATWVPGALMNHWVQLAIIAPVMFYTGWPIHRTGWLTLQHRSADMNSLITLGTTAAFAYSLLVTLAPRVLPADVRDVYYEAVGVIITLILLGRLLEARARAGTGEAIRQLVGLQARTARVLRGDDEIEVRIEDVEVDDVVVIRPGEKVPVDGVRLPLRPTEGTSLVPGRRATEDRCTLERCAGHALRDLQGSGKAGPDYHSPRLRS